MVDCGLFQGRILRGRASPSYCISEAGVQKLPGIGYSSLYSVHVMQNWSIFVRFSKEANLIGAYI